jgi:YjjG family noncanonical pyrimidine nucleotidase
MYRLMTIRMKKQDRKNYTCVFFDLDHTLWDYDTNSRETLCELFEHYNLAAHGVEDVERFIVQFNTVNLELWDRYDRGLIDSTVIRHERFKRILEPFNCAEETLCEALSADYLRICPTKGNVMPKAVETLEYLSGRYNLAIITNGFDEIQRVKLASGNLARFFNHVITSQNAGHRKPAREIFLHALALNKACCEEALMIGDNLLTDIGGARNASIDAVFYNPARLKHDAEVPYEIGALEELRQIL